MVLSDDYFAAEDSAMRLSSGIREFQETHRIAMENARPRVHGLSFTITAWVETQPLTAAGTYVLRKPLGATEATRSLSCWAWFIGDRPRLSYGAHDYEPTAAAGTSAAEA